MQLCVTLQVLLASNELLSKQPTGSSNRSILQHCAQQLAQPTMSRVEQYFQLKMSDTAYQQRRIHPLSPSQPKVPF
jgi:hypothetical protein